ncbi:MAG: right-handed parallel beta-helix repeat-containing protein [Holophaga sp.]|jgi:hypothetical protein
MNLIQRAFPLFLILALAPAARAQATRTWISGVGDDSNPDSRTAPGATFAGAFANTATDGEIDVLDPGQYGTVTISKGMTLDRRAALGTVTVPSGPGIVVNAPGAVVLLRNLDLCGSGTTGNGITFQAGALLVLEHCRIHGFTQNALEVDAAAGQLVMKDVILTGSAVGLAVTASASGLVASLQDLVVQGNGVGIQASAGSVGISRSLITGNRSAGVQATTGAAVRATDSGIYDNGAGFQSLGGAVASDGRNRVAGNTAGSTPPTAVVTLQ